MAAVTGPGLSPPPPPRGRRRWWLIGVIVGWIVVVAVLGTWSVWHSPATVPEQRDVASVVPELQRAAGVVYAAADGNGRVVVLGELELIGGCRITPVRHGYVVARDLTVYVAEGGVEAALDGIAEALPKGYKADVAVTRGGTRIGLHADAGNFVGVDTSAQTVAKAVTLRLTSGCRPGPETGAGTSDPAAGAVPAELDAVVRGLGGKAAAPEVRTVACPDGGVAGSYTVDVDTPADLDARMRQLATGADVVRSDATAWAYRKGVGSVVVTPDGKRVRVSVGTSC